VVVTGIGLVTPLAIGAIANWSRLLAGDSGITHLPSDLFGAFPSQIGGLVDREALKGEPNLATFVQFAVIAAAEALEDAQWSPVSAELKARTGVSIGAGIGSIADIDETLNVLSGRGHRRITPRFIPKILINMASGEVSIRHGFTGPNVASVAACATGTHAIADAFRLISLGDADVMVAGGTESCIHPLAVGGALLCIRCQVFIRFFSHVPQVSPASVPCLPGIISSQRRHPDRSIKTGMDS
jgi:3-oxoacyl-[acyl-carrier-protein] synthase II